jgi:ligand-binding sensor domain-containing protein
MKIEKFTLTHLFIFLLVTSAGSQEWTSYTNSNTMRQIMVESGLVWGATSGGIINYSIASDEINKLTNTDGLGGIDYNCIEVDSAGALWFGAADGWLSKISATGEIINYPVEEDVGGFFDRRITIYDLSADGDVLWVANDLGVSKFLIYSNGGEIKDTATRLGDLEDEEDIKSIAVIGDNVWAGSDSGLAFTNKTNPNIQDPVTWRSFHGGDFPTGMAGINTIAAYYDTVVVGMDSGLFKLQTVPDTAWIEMGVFSNLEVRKILFHNDILYVVTNAGIRFFDGLTWSSITNEGLVSGLADIAFDENEKLWAATMGSGLASFEDSLWVLYSIPGPASNFINNMAIDSAGALWMTHDARGLSKFDGSEWSVYNSSNSGLEENGAHSITVAGDGSIWVGSWGGGLYRNEGGEWYHWTADNCPMYGVPGNLNYWAAAAVETDQSGVVWVSTIDADSGLVMGVFNPADSIWHVYYEGPITIQENTVGSFRAQGNSMWIGSTQGLHKLDYKGTQFFEGDDSWLNYIIRDFIGDIALDPFGNIWVGAPAGLFYIESSTNIARQVGLPLEIAGSVQSVAADGVGDIWVGTVAGAGVLRPDKVTWKAIYTTANSPLLNNEISDIEIDLETGIVYLGTFGGLSIFDSGVEQPSEDLSDVAAFPNPVLVEQGHDAVSFKRVPTEALISIYTVSGDLVKSFRLSEEPQWDLENSKGESVAAGIYFFSVDYRGKTGTGKFAIIK